jgi:hypothetical protein
MPDFPELRDGDQLRARPNSTEEKRRARMTVAREAQGVYDCARLLEMLGLVPDGAALTVVVP